MREKLDRLSAVTIFLGYGMVIFGILNFINGIGGIIAGIINIILGVKLINVSKNAKGLLEIGEIDESDYFDLFSNLVTYFNIQAVLLSISILFIVFTVLAHL